MAVVHVLNNQTSKNPDIMVLVRRFVIACMRQNILIHAEHIPGIYNVLPDLLSRLQIDKFRELAPNVDPEPTTLPLDHLTMPWMQQFPNFCLLPYLPRLWLPTKMPLTATPHSTAPIMQTPR